MTKRMLIDALHPEEMRVAIADERQIFDFDFVSAAKKQLKGNIYLAKITRVEPSLQAAFVEYGGGKQGFLPFSEIHADYYQIPVSDRKRLIEESEYDESQESLENETTSQYASPEDASSEFQSESSEAADISADAAEDRFSPAADDSAAAAPGLPTLEAIPETPEYNTEPAAEEAPSETAAAHSIGFSTSEVVAADSMENEQLASQLADEPVETKEERPEGGVETLASEEEEISDRRKRNHFSRRYKIQEVIKRGQIVLVQVIKEERGNKGASLTTYLSLAGRYCVLMPNSPKDGGISRKISDGDTRKRLKEMVAELKLARGMSVIIRTAGVDRTRAEIRRDFDYLVKLWNRIRETTLASTAPALIYEESDLIKRSIRDQYSSDIEEIVIEGEEAFQSAREFMKILMPSHTARIKQHKESMPLFYAYNIEDQLLSMHDPVVKLKSGGYMVLNPTEALIAIDVNSGRSTGERNIEETATKTNLEAANEVARQLRLRDLAGLIVIDFIDMMDSRNRRAVERALKDALKNDRAKIQLGRISPFGLLEMSRQRMRPSISETNMVQCQHCIGRGIIRSNESMSIQIVRALEKEAATGNWNALKLNAPETTALHMLNHKRHLLASLEERHGVQISIAIDHALTASAFTVEKTRRGQTSPRQDDENRGERDRSRDRDRGRNRPGRGPRRDREEAIERPEEEPIEMVAEESEGGDDSRPSDAGQTDEQRRRGRRRGRRGGRGRNNFRDTPAGENESVDAAPMDGTEAGTIEEISDRPQRTERPDRPRGERGGRRGERGGRGRRRWQGDENATAQSFNEGGEQPRPAADSNVDSLPPFTRSPVIIEQPQRSPELVSHNPPPQREAAPPPSTHRPDGAPPRKGWWQKIIELE